MSSNIPAAAQIVAAYQGSISSIGSNIVMAVLLLYDVLLTSGQEYRYIWRTPKTWVSRVLYMWNRYMILLFFILNLGISPSMSGTSCASFGWLINVLGILNMIGPAVFTTLRIYTLSTKNRILGVVALVLSMAPIVINASAAYQRLPTNLPAPLNCENGNTGSKGFNIGLSIASRGSLILVDSLAVAVTWCQTRAAIQLRTGTLKRPSLEQVMWANGAIYFCTLASLNVVDMVLIFLPITIIPDQGSSYAVALIDPITSILNGRFLLALHETNARLEGVVGASISSLSLGIVSGDDPRAGPSVLPQILGPIGGPVHSFDEDSDNDDIEDDVESVDFASPSQDRPQSEFEEDLQSDGGGENAA